MGLGNLLNHAKHIAKEIKDSLDIQPTIINPVFYSGLDAELLDSLKKDHEIVITLEDGILEGGFGQKVAGYLGNTNLKVLNYGAKKEFTDRVSLDELYTRYRMKANLIIEDIKSILN